MTEFINDSIADLLKELKYAPLKKKLELMDAAENLFWSVNPEQEYPFEFVCFKITDYRPRKDASGIVISGTDLKTDLQLFILCISQSISEPVQFPDQPVFSIKDLADKLQVSTKTINRWRERGLLLRSFIFEDGKRRLGVIESSLEKFLSVNESLVGRAKSFTQLNDKEKEQIKQLAINYAKSTNWSRKKIISEVASEINRAEETVRYTLIDYEKQHPNQPIFSKPSGVISPSEGARIYKLFKQGATIADLMDKYDRSKSSIYRIVNQHRARQLLRLKIDYIHSAEFESKTTLEEILLIRLSFYPVKAISFKAEPDTINDYLSSIKTLPLLNRDQEYNYFRKYNGLKYAASSLRETIDRSRPSSTKLKKIEKYLSEAERIKNCLIESNLRLVVSIASRHLNQGIPFADLISEGNLAMMRAIEKFDYYKGYRFSTYAGLAIAKDFARKLPAETSRLDRAGTADLSATFEDIREDTLKDFTAVEKASKSLDEVIRTELNEKEQFIIINHFGLSGSLIRKKSKSLNQIGKELGISKERVRQIELKALQKLRHSMTSEEFEILMENG